MTVADPGRHVHRIETLTLECGFSREAVAWEEQSRLEDFLRGPGQEIIATVFERWSPSEEIWRIDQLQIDLGYLGAQEADAVWAARLESCLEERLLHLERVDSAADPGAHQSQRAHDLEAFAYYLAQGYLPWSQGVSTRAELSAWLEQLAEQWGPDLLELLRAIPAGPRLRQVLSRILPLAALRTLAHHAGVRVEDPDLGQPVRLPQPNQATEWSEVVAVLLRHLQPGADGGPGDGPLSEALSAWLAAGPRQEAIAPLSWARTRAQLSRLARRSDWRLRAAQTWEAPRLLAGIALLGTAGTGVAVAADWAWLAPTVEAAAEQVGASLARLGLIPAALGADLAEGGSHPFRPGQSPDRASPWAGLGRQWLWAAALDWAVRHPGVPLQGAALRAHWRAAWARLGSGQWLSAWDASPGVQPLASVAAAQTDPQAGMTAAAQERPGAQLQLGSGAAFQADPAPGPAAYAVFPLDASLRPALDRLLAPALPRRVLEREHQVLVRPAQLRELFDRPFSPRGRRLRPGLWGTLTADTQDRPEALLAWLEAGDPRSALTPRQLVKARLQLARRVRRQGWRPELGGPSTVGKSGPARQQRDPGADPGGLGLASGRAGGHRRAAWSQPGTARPDPGRVRGQVRAAGPGAAVVVGRRPGLGGPASGRAAGSGGPAGPLAGGLGPAGP